MHYGVCVPTMGIFSNPHLLIKIAQEVEQSGWDGFFMWDHIALGTYAVPMIDPWIALAAIATSTERIRFGPMVTPLPRRRPWKVAREALALDHLSHGRFILGVGIGNDPFSLENFGEETDIKERALMLDEALEILVGLWSGEPFQYNSTHYSIRDTVFLPQPIQAPRIPIWLAGTWPYKAPMRRGARWDGIIPSGGNADTVMPLDALHEMIAYLREQRTVTTPFDIIQLGGRTTGDDPMQDATIITPYVQAGVTWWLEDIHLHSINDWERWSAETAFERIRKGPPKV